MLPVTLHLAAVLDKRFFSLVGLATCSVLLKERLGPDASGIPPWLSIHGDRALESLQIATLLR
jgi:hypothetical protein